MTERQAKGSYWPAWGRVALAEGWRTERGRLVAQRPQSTGPDEMAQLRARIWDAAGGRARAGHHGIGPNDLRHGCHAVALGRDKSSLDLDNRELDRVVTLFRLLADPSDLDTMMAWLHPEIGERRRLVWSIKHLAPEAYINAIAKAKFAGQYEWPYWEDLPVNSLRQLAMTLRARAGGKRMANGEWRVGAGATAEAK